MIDAAVADLMEPVASANVRRIREACLANGYEPIRVLTGGKRPLSAAWNFGEKPDDLFTDAPHASNTGIITRGLRVIDIDVDDSEIVAEVLRVLQATLPAPIIIRSRDKSPRIAMLYRAASGEPPKRVAGGRLGKVEVLGAGQQVVAFGLHPSGSALKWVKDRGPHNINREDLPSVTEEEIDQFLKQCEVLLSANADAGMSRPILTVQNADLGKLPPASHANINLEFTAGIGATHWFDRLSPEEKRACIQQLLAAIDNRIEDPRDRWLAVGFAIADAGHRGCPDADEMFVEWSRQGRGWNGEDACREVLESFKPHRLGRITIGTLINLASEEVDVSRWRGAPPVDNPAGKTFEGAVSGSKSAAVALSEVPRAHRLRDLPAMPAKRQWIHGTDAVRGAVSLLVAPGGKGKSSWLVMFSLACASGQRLLGSTVFGGRKRVLHVSAEDGTPELNLRMRAAMQHHGLTEGDVPGLRLLGAEELSFSLLRPNGSSAALDQGGWAILLAIMQAEKPDVLVLDPLISLMGGVTPNDNAAAAQLMRRLVQLATECRCAIVIAHHTSKGRDLGSADAAMGAASLVNLSRIVLNLDPLSEAGAANMGMPPWTVAGVFRVVGTKQNLSRPGESDRWFRVHDVEMANAEPPNYPNGDRVGVVEVFEPASAACAYPQGMVQDGLRAISAASPALSPTKRAGDRYAAPVVAQAISRHRGGQYDELGAERLVDHLIRTRLIEVGQVKVPRPGGRADDRKGLLITSAGRARLELPA